MQDAFTAIQATLPQDGRSTGRKPDGGSQPSPIRHPHHRERWHGSQSASNEVHYSEEGRIDWLEWINLG